MYSRESATFLPPTPPPPTPSSKKEGHIALHMLVDMLVGIMVCQYPPKFCNL